MTSLTDFTLVPLASTLSLSTTLSGGVTPTKVDTAPSPGPRSSTGSPRATMAAGSGVSPRVAEDDSLMHKEEEGQLNPCPQFLGPYQCNWQFTNSTNNMECGHPPSY